MREYLGDIISIIVVALLSITLCYVVYMGSKHGDEERWNNGHCDNCGGEWKYEQAVGHRSFTSYIYVCEDCGKRIEISSIRKER